MNITETEINQLFESYEAASNTKVFSRVAEFIHPDATYRFTERRRQQQPRVIDQSAVVKGHTNPVERVR